MSAITKEFLIWVSEKYPTIYAEAMDGRPQGLTMKLREEYRRSKYNTTNATNGKRYFDAMESDSTRQ